MGDHRASIKCEFKMHGVEDKCDMWINWSSAPGECDTRVIEWFAAVADRAMKKWDDERWEAERESREKAEREHDLAELERLKAKYEGKT